MVYKWFSALVEELRSNEVSFLNVFGYHMVSPELDGKKYHPVTSWTSQITSICLKPRFGVGGTGLEPMPWRHVDSCGPISQLPRNLNSSKIIKDHWSLIGSSYHQSIIHINPIPTYSKPTQWKLPAITSRQFGYPHDAHLWPEDMP
jgi:hypothetical protein